MISISLMSDARQDSKEKMGMKALRGSRKKAKVFGDRRLWAPWGDGRSCNATLNTRTLHRSRFSPTLTGYRKQSKPTTVGSSPSYHIVCRLITSKRLML
ncbi:hypothetical protein KC357_g246 [Hortaea werneckii]|nr:hypothetical protein KC357_g246 [Hortaea werneckii]